MKREQVEKIIKLTTKLQRKELERVNKLNKLALDMARKANRVPLPPIKPYLINPLNIEEIK